MAFQPPRLGSLTFTNPPDSVLVFPEVIQQVNELHDGQTRQRILGYRHRAILEWSDNWLRGSDLSGLQAVANDASATLTFEARPGSVPSITFTMIWTNKAQFTYWNGKFGVYNGSIELVSAGVTASATLLP